MQDTVWKPFIPDKTEYVIFHPVYGKGMIQNVVESEEGYLTTIEFERERKTLLSLFDPFENSASWQNV